ncbi:UNVERIFIED_ORG: hypothetical protein J2Y81_000355 [Paraburkholderia sediminicola]|nr:hypothetical protein [Paraburkholderia sediminicola]
MRLIFVDLTGFVNPCSLHRAASSKGRARAAAPRSILNYARRFAS